MKAITLDSHGLEFSPSHPEPIPAAGESIVRVIQAGICETDLQLAKGYMGFQGIPGHEFVGIAEHGRYTGKRVVGEINCSCHQCQTCKSGNPTHCPHRTVVGIDRHDGAFAEHVAIPDANLHLIPDNVSNDEAVFVEPLAAAFQILDQVDIRKDDQIAILGDGRLAFLSAQVLSLATSHLTVFGKHESKLQRFENRSLQTIAIQSTDPSEMTPNQFDLVVDCTGSTTGLPMAIHLVKPRGTIVMKTTVASPHDLSLAAIVIDEISVVGSRCGPFDKAIQALSRRDIDVSGLITDRLRLESVQDAFAAAKETDSFKVIFDIAKLR